MLALCELCSGRACLVQPNAHRRRRLRRVFIGKRSAVQCLPLPASVSLEDGALVEPLAVGLHRVRVAQMTPGARVLVIGAGPIGLATVFWARRLGAGRVAVTASSNRREALAYTLGATAFIDPADSSPQAVSRALGAPPDVVFECVGKPGLLARSIEHVQGSRDRGKPLA